MIWALHTSQAYVECIFPETTILLTHSLTLLHNLDHKNPCTKWEHLSFWYFSQTSSRYLSAAFLYLCLWLLQKHHVHFQQLCVPNDKDNHLQKSKVCFLCIVMRTSNIWLSLNCIIYTQADCMIPRDTICCKLGINNIKDFFSFAITSRSNAHVIKMRCNKLGSVDVKNSYLTGFIFSTSVSLEPSIPRLNGCPLQCSVIYSWQWGPIA